MTQAVGENRKRAGAFDIRNIIGGLIGLYGLVLVPVGLFDQTDAESDKADGVNVNLWAGIAMLVVAIAFITWSYVRPVVVPAHVEENPDAVDDAG